MPATINRLVIIGSHTLCGWSLCFTREPLPDALAVKWGVKPGAHKNFMNWRGSKRWHKYLLTASPVGVPSLN
jgi:hypothetical protein